MFQGLRASACGPFFQSIRKPTTRLPQNTKAETPSFWAKLTVTPVCKLNVNCAGQFILKYALSSEVVQAQAGRRDLLRQENTNVAASRSLLLLTVLRVNANVKTVFRPSFRTVVKVAIYKILSFTLRPVTYFY